MKKNIFSIVFLTVFLTAICFTVSCSEASELALTPEAAATALLSVASHTPEPEPSPSSSSGEPSPEPVATATPVPRATAADSQPTAFVSEEIKISYVDPATQQTFTKITTVTDKNDVQAALDAVKDTFLTQTYGDIKVNKVVQNNGNIFIDFTDSIYILAENPSEEYTALESIANAYLDNIKDAKAVYFTVNGGGYSSMNMEYDADEPFKTK